MARIMNIRNTGGTNAPLPEVLELMPGNPLEPFLRGLAEVLASLTTSEPAAVARAAGRLP